MKSSLVFLLLFIFSSLHSQISRTYIFGDIPTNYPTYNETCEGYMTIQLPLGEDVEVLGINISYSMTALGSNWMSDQRSRVRCVNTNIVESEVSGVGISAGTYDYQRENVTIANGLYPGGTVLQFEMEAYRTFFDGLTPYCNSFGNRIDNNTWTIEVMVDQLIPLVGINTDTPNQSLSVEGKLSIGNDYKAPTEGTMRYNETTENFEGWTGTKWKSMSYSPQVYSYVQHGVTDSYSSTIRDSLLAYPDSLLIEEPGTYMCLFDMTLYNLFGNTTSLTSDISATVYFSVYNTNNFRYVGPNIVGLPAGYTFYFRERETFQMHKIIEIPIPNSYMHIRYRINKNACCDASTSTYSLTDIKMTAIKLD